MKCTGAKKHALDKALFSYSHAYYMFYSKHFFQCIM